MAEYFTESRWIWIAWDFERVNDKHFDYQTRAMWVCVLKRQHRMEDDLSSVYYRKHLAKMVDESVKISLPNWLCTRMPNLIYVILSRYSISSWCSWFVQASLSRFALYVAHYTGMSSHLTSDVTNDEVCSWRQEIQNLLLAIILTFHATRNIRCALRSSYDWT